MNIHPMIVHFPIALWTLYCLLELLHFKGLNKLSYWFYIKASFVIAGTVSAFFALMSGEMIEDLFEQGPLANVVEAHSFFASLSTWIFAAISFFYIILWLDKMNLFYRIKSHWVREIADVAVNLSHFVITTWFIFIPVLAGLAAIIVTGALGGSMVYGQDVDPLVSFVYNLFFK